MPRSNHFFESTILILRKFAIILGLEKSGCCVAFLVTGHFQWVKYSTFSWHFTEMVENDRKWPDVHLWGSRKNFGRERRFRPFFAQIVSPSDIITYDRRNSVYQWLQQKYWTHCIPWGLVIKVLRLPAFWAHEWWCNIIFKGYMNKRKLEIYIK